jgi:hypothetical protein
MKNKDIPQYTLYPRLVANIISSSLEETDLELLTALAQLPEAKEDGTIEDIVKPRAIRVGDRGYMVPETCCDYAGKMKKLVIERWAISGASGKFLGILRAAQRQMCRQFIVLDGGMIVEPRKPAKIGKIGKKGLGRKKTRRLLKTLKIMYEGDWPLEQLANVTESYAKLTAGGKRKK